MKNKLRVLFFDIETRYIIFRGWRTGKQYVDQHQIVPGQDSDIICIAYKWLGDPTVHVLDWGLNQQNSAKMIEAFSKVVESADLCVGHNADRFDIRHINTQRLIHNQPPIAWPSSEDTLKQIRKHFYLPSYKLDYISKLLTGSGKIPMQLDDWVAIVERKDPKAFEKILRYCKHDVSKLSQVYKRVSKYMTHKAHAGVSVGLLANQSCPRCAGTQLSFNGTKLLATGRYRRLLCTACAHTWRSSFRV